MQMRTSAVIKRDRVIINILPIIIAVILFVVILSIVKDEQLPKASIGLSISSTMIGVWATCLGFMITAVSILLALNGSNYIGILKKTGHYKTILICFMSCCFHILIALIIAIVVTFLQKWTVTIFAIVCASTIDVVLIMGVCLYFLWVIVVKIDD